MAKYFVLCTYPQVPSTCNCAKSTLYLGQLLCTWYLGQFLCTWCDQVQASTGQLPWQVLLIFEKKIHVCPHHPLQSPMCDQIDFFQATRILAQNVKKRHGKFLASQQSDRISDKQETLTL